MIWYNIKKKTHQYLNLKKIKNFPHFKNEAIRSDTKLYSSVPEFNNERLYFYFRFSLSLDFGNVRDAEMHRIIR